MPYNRNKKDDNNGQDKKHSTIKIVLIIVGAVFLVTGLILVIVAFADFFSKFGDFDAGMPTKFWMFFLGFPCIFIGASCLIMGLRRNISRYIKNESVPIINEFSNDIRPAVRNFTQTIKGEEDIVCAYCGAENDHDSAFCKKCAKPIRKVCQSCGASVDPDSAFCKGCGKPLK